MNDLVIFLDFLSRAFAVLLAIGGILGFFFRRWVGAWIDAHFKQKVDTELKSLEHQHSLALEEKKSSLAKELIIESEQLKAGIGKDLEREKRQLDEIFRRKTRIFDQKSSLYSTFEVEYSAIFAEMYALDGKYMDKLNSTDPRLGNAIRESFLSKAHSRLVEAQQKLAPFQPFVEVDYKLRMAKLFAALSTFMADGATDKKRLDELALEKGIISAELQSELLDETT
jgi:hypothetical protein